MGMGGNGNVESHSRTSLQQSTAGQRLFLNLIIRHWGLRAHRPEPQHRVRPDLQDQDQDDDHFVLAWDRSCHRPKSQTHHCTASKFYMVTNHRTCRWQNFNRVHHARPTLSSGPTIFWPHYVRSYILPTDMSGSALDWCHECWRLKTYKPVWQLLLKICL